MTIYQGARAIDQGPGTKDQRRVGNGAGGGGGKGESLSALGSPGQFSKNRWAEGGDRGGARGGQHRNNNLYFAFGQIPETRDRRLATRDQGPGTVDQTSESREQRTCTGMGPGTDQGPESRDQGAGNSKQGPGSREQGPEHRGQRSATRD